MTNIKNDELQFSHFLIMFFKNLFMRYIKYIIVQTSRISHAALEDKTQHQLFSLYKSGTFAEDSNMS